MLLTLQVGKKEDDADHKSAKAHNGNDKQGKAMYQQNINQCQQNADPRNL